MGVSSCRADDDSENLRITVELRVSSDGGSGVLFYPSFSIFLDDLRLLPIFDHGGSDVVILPGETNVRTIRTALPPMRGRGGGMVKVRAESWNGATLRAEIDLASCAAMTRIDRIERERFY